MKGASELIRTLVQLVINLKTAKALADDPAVTPPAGRPGDRVMDRRSFIGTLAGGLLAAPLVAEAQPAGKVWRIGMRWFGRPFAVRSRSTTRSTSFARLAITPPGHEGAMAQ
jgi:hypothetical protein